MDCGPACLQMIAQHYGQSYPLSELREQSFLSQEGVTLRGVKAAAEAIGLRARGVRLTFEQLARPAAWPCIVYWRQRHFLVVYAVVGDTVSVADPSSGLRTYSRQEFLAGWLDQAEQGVAFPHSQVADILINECGLPELVPVEYGGTATKAE